MKNVLKLSPVLLVSAFFLYLVFRKIDPGQVLLIIYSTDLVYIACGLAALSLILYAKSLRLGRMFGREKPVSTSVAFESIAIGVMGNNLLPFRIGDLAQLFFIGLKAGISRASVLSALMAEKVFDIATMGIVVLAASLFVPLPQGISVMRVLAFTVGLVVSVTAVLSAGKGLPRLVVSLVPKGVLHDRVRAAADNFISSLQYLGTLGVISRLVVLTGMLWLAQSLGVYMCLLAVHVKVSYWACFFLLAMSGLGMMIPASPGSLGTVEFFLILGLSVFGVDRNHAVSFAIVYRLLSWLPFNLAGLAVLVRNSGYFKTLVSNLTSPIPPT